MPFYSSRLSPSLMSAARSREPSFNSHSSDSTPHVSARDPNKCNLLDFVNSPGIAGEPDQNDHQLENADAGPPDEFVPSRSSRESNEPPPVRVDSVSLLSLSSNDSKGVQSNISDRTGNPPAESGIAETERSSSSESNIIFAHMADQASRDLHTTERVENLPSMQLLYQYTRSLSIPDK